MKRVRLRRGDVICLCGDDLAVIRRDAARVFPAEACGLLLGGPGKVEAVLAMANQSSAPDRFEIAVTDLVAAHRLARQQGRAVIGHYHSHPNGQARPSPVDIAAIADPSAIWIIVAVDPRTGEVGEVTAWRPQAVHLVEGQGNPGFQPVAMLVWRPVAARGQKNKEYRKKSLDGGRSKV